MSHNANLAPPAFDVHVTTQGQLPGAAEYARTKIGGLGRFAHRPVLHARVRLTRHSDPAVQCPVVAQANLDVQGRFVRAQAQGETAREAIDLLEARLRGRLQRAAAHVDERRACRDTPHEWTNPRPTEDRRVVRHKSFSPAACSVDEAARDMDLLDYDFHFFTEKATGVASVLYRAGPTGYRLAQVVPCPGQLAPFELPLTVSSQPAPCITVEQATERLGLLGLPFLFFIDAAQGRAGVLYQRYDGHYALITPSD